jgi:hypothetical protein
MRERDYYISFRQKYEPEKLKLIVVAESPPVSGLYFYDPIGKVSEPLFSALMQQIGCSPSNKEQGLAALCRKGWLLVDATYQQVNEKNEQERDSVIICDYPLLVEDLSRLSPDRAVPLVLIKANVCPLLEPRLLADGFNVANRGRVPYFPSTGRQNQFHREFGEIIRSL